MKKIIATLAVAATFSALAETTTAPATSTASTQTLKQKLQATPFSLSVLNDSYMSSKGADGLEMENYIDLKYKIDKNHSLKLSNVFNTNMTRAQKNQDQVHSKFLQSDLSITRSKILTEEKSGVNLSATLLNTFLGQTSRIGDAGGRATRHSISTSFSKELNKVISLSSGQAFYKYNRTSGAVTSTDNYMTLSLTPTFTINDNLSISLTNIWYKTNSTTRYTSGAESNEYLRFIPSVDFSSGDFSAGVYFDGHLLDSHDEFAGFVNKWHEKGAVGMTLGYNLF